MHYDRCVQCFLVVHLRHSEKLVLRRFVKKAKSYRIFNISSDVGYLIGDLNNTALPRCGLIFPRFVKILDRNRNIPWFYAVFIKLSAMGDYTVTDGIGKV